ncbi:unnamed protein product [Arctogadus glacialis]
MRPAANTSEVAQRGLEGLKIKDSGASQNTQLRPTSPAVPQRHTSRRWMTGRRGFKPAIVWPRPHHCGLGRVKRLLAPTPSLIGTAAEG